MLPKDFITKDFPVLKSFDTGQYALSVMNRLKVRHLPLADDGVYKRLVCEKDLPDMPDLSASVGGEPLFAPCVTEDTHLHEVLAQMSCHALTVLPVVGPGGKYAGAITTDKLLDAMAEGCNAGAPGSVIVLEMWQKDYVLSDIARIIEANNAHLLNLLYNIDPASGLLRITLKIDLEDATPVLRSFERFNYTVARHFMPKGTGDETLQRQIDELLFMINM
jgi:CBS domain-containing protein